MTAAGKRSKARLAWAGAAGALAVLVGGFAVCAATGVLWFEHPARGAGGRAETAPVRQVPSRLPTDAPSVVPTPTPTAAVTAAPTAVSPVTPGPAASTVPKSKGGASSGHSSGGGTSAAAPPPTTIVIPGPTITIPVAPPPPPYTDAEAIADVEKESPDAKYGLVTADCHSLNYGEWSPGSSPPWPERERVGAGGQLAFTAYASGGDGYVQYYACY